MNTEKITNAVTAAELLAMSDEYVEKMLDEGCLLTTESPDKKYQFFIEGLPKNTLKVEYFAVHDRPQDSVESRKLTLTFQELVSRAESVKRFVRNSDDLLDAIVEERVNFSNG